ncbi:MAG: hypothetical protein JO145_12945 [Acidobacteriaceae bacterium]|nr:hypothetical protein [Acidobacteriaceae bacterium]
MRAISLFSLLALTTLCFTTTAIAQSSNTAGNYTLTFAKAGNYMPIDAIQEISMDASNAPAQYGNGLTSLNLMLRSGTNDFHGSSYQFVQNTALNALGFYNQTGRKSVDHWNKYSGSIGAPILKIKLFFFNFQRNPSSTPVAGLYTYPTAAMQAGDFYGITASSGPAFNNSGMLVGSYDPVALKLQRYFPKRALRVRLRLSRSGQP